MSGMITIREAVEHLFPGVTFGVSGEGADCELRDDGAGPYIAAWNRPEPKPTEQEISAAMLPAAKASVIPRIKAERDKRKFEGVTVGEHRFHSDPDSRTQQLGLVMLGANVPAVEWKTLTPDGEPDVYVTMTQTLAGQIFAATAARDIAVFDCAKQHIAAVTALESAEAVLAYDYSTGWPE